MKQALRASGMAVLLALLMVPTSLSAKARLRDDQAEIAAFEAVVNGMIQRKEVDAMQALAVQLLSPEQQWASGAPKQKKFFRILGLTLDGSEQVGSELWAPRDKFVEEWCMAYPKSHIPLLVRSSLWFEYAWDARGKGFSNSVSGDQKDLYKERLKVSARHLKRAELLGARKLDPFFFVMTLDLGNSTGRSKKELLEVYKESRQLFPGHSGPLASLIWGLLPRWGGAEEMAAVVQEELKRDQAMATRALLVHFDRIKADSEGLPWTFLGYATRDLLWKAVLPGMERIDRQYPLSVRNLNDFANFADLMGYTDQAVKYLQMAEGRADNAVWYFDEDKERLRELVKLLPVR